MIEHLERIAKALERIADAMAPEADVSEPQAVEVHPTLLNPLLAWFATAHRSPDVVSDALSDAAFSDLTPSSSSPMMTGEIIIQRGRPKNRVSHCGRCGREETRRMNHSDSCRECVHEPWWTE